jgi:hypothetical protein
MKSIITWGRNVLTVAVFCLFFKGRFLCFEILLLSSNLPVKSVMFVTVCPNRVLSVLGYITTKHIPANVV